MRGLYWRDNFIFSVLQFTRSRDSNSNKLPRLTIKGAFDGTDSFVEREPTCNIENVRDNDRSKAKFGKREKKLAGSSDAGRQSSSQSSLSKYFHSRPAKHR